MGSTPGLMILLLCNLGLHLSAEQHSDQQNCPPTFKCGTLGVFGYPFTPSFNPGCGLCVLNCTEPVQTVGLTSTGPWYDIQNSFSYNRSFLVSDPYLLHVVNDDKCNVFEDSFKLPKSRSVSFTVLLNRTLWKCPEVSDVSSGNKSGTLRRISDCTRYNVYHNNDTDEILTGCSTVQYPAVLIVELSDKCSKCLDEAGHCKDLTNEGFRCIKGKGNRRRLLLGIGISAGSVFMLVLVLFFWCLKLVRSGSIALSSGNVSREPKRMKTDLEGSKVYFSVPVFSYSELQEATNNFNPSRELGDGGFGTVYYGKLKDGREVAVKRLYERNFRRVEHFMNEVEILACLRHQNLVSLYGCTSRRSRELLLVYEFVPNGTVADHLHGGQAKCGVLPWPIRLSIAIETASALVYLHASDIIHRDVKSNNILLDNNFSVKIADFGLSRLFPVDVTHVSTAPQGTPGYLDPEYNQCYQLTDKSDVYSFGVVLAELISSLPAVDMSRQEDEINLSHYAMKRIQCSAVYELFDHRLGFESSYKTKKMMTLVAELAFQCLQQKKDMRPSMVEVLEALKSIQSAESDVEEADGEEPIIRASKARMHRGYSWLLTNTENPPSPSSVMQKWDSSKSATSTTSR